jgi:FkbM family methyltransferase
MSFIKLILKKNKYVYNISLFLYSIYEKLVDATIPFSFQKLTKRPFTFKMINGEGINFYPEGQLAKRIFSNSFENFQLNAFQQILKPSMVVVDAGANIGLYSMIASKIVSVEGKVFAFEPSIESFNRLNSNIKLNNLKNIIYINEGLGEEANNLILRQDEGYGDAERYLFSDNEAPDIGLEDIILKNEEEIVINTLDNNLLKRNINKIDFLKIDTEGFEYYILKGAEEILKNSPDIVIFMECTPFGTARANTSQAEVFKILEDNNLNIFFWNHDLNEWSDDRVGALSAGEVWVCKNIKQLNIN